MKKLSLIQRNDGITLIGLLIAMTVAALLILGITRMYTQTVNSTSVNEQYLRMEQTGSHAITTLSDLLMEVGANLPRDEVCILPLGSNHDSLRIFRNVRGASHTIRIPTENSTLTSVLDAEPFLGVTILDRITPGTTPTFSTLALSDFTGTTSEGTFVEGVDTTNDQLMFATATSLEVSERIYVRDTSYIWHDRASEFIKHLTDGNTQELADNIDTLRVKFFENDGVTETTNWATMRVCSLTVVVVSPVADQNYTLHPDKRRRTRYDRLVLLRNRSYQN